MLGTAIPMVATTSTPPAIQRTRRRRSHRRALGPFGAGGVGCAAAATRGTASLAGAVPEWGGDGVSASGVMPGSSRGGRRNGGARSDTLPLLEVRGRQPGRRARGTEVEPATQRARAVSDRFGAGE